MNTSLARVTFDRLTYMETVEVLKAMHASRTAKSFPINTSNSALAEAELNRRLAALLDTLLQSADLFWSRVDAAPPLSLHGRCPG